MGHETRNLTDVEQGYRHRLEHLIAEGRTLREAIAETPDSTPLQATLAAWQRRCASTIHGLSGGSKAHWLSRAYSESLLVPSAAPRPGSGQAADAVSVPMIINRVLDVLARAGASLEQAEAPSIGGEAQPPRARFTFITDEVLRASLEHAYRDAHAAFNSGASAVALVTFCSILEAVLTEALERLGPERLAPYDPPGGPIASWPFATRIAVGERARIISGGCARLPGVARQYRALLDERGEIHADAPVSAGDAMRASQVLHVVLRDLAPGR